MTLGILWYLVLIVAMVCYAVLDGFDLGVGALHLFTKKDEEKRIFLNAIGPVWDGNEVWLVIVGGALFAGFPEVYATMFSSFYNLMMILIAGLIFRAVSIEFRSKLYSPKWRMIWDTMFSVASLVIAFGIGLVLGNLVEGIPLNESLEYSGTFWHFFKPYSILLGVTTVALFMMHGAIYLVMKTEGSLHNRLRKWVHYCMAFFVVAYIATTVSTLIHMPHMADRLYVYPWLFIIPLLAVLAIANIPLQMKKRNDGWAFISSCCCIALLLSLFSIGTYPYMIRSTIEPAARSLQIFNSASSPLTLKVLLIIVAIGIPLVLAYGAYIYHLFRGKVKIEKTSY